MQNIQKYDSVVRFNHWFSALIILWATLSGIYISELSNNIQLKETISFINVSVTTLLIPFFLFRVVYKYGFTPHMSLNNSLSSKIAEWAHDIIYTVVCFVLISGVLMMDHPINVFNVFEVPRVIFDPAVNHSIELLHKYACRLLTVLIGLHIAAVIKHQLAGIPVLRRMI